MALNWLVYQLNSPHDPSDLLKAPKLALRPNRPQSQAEKTADRDPQQDVFLREVDDALREEQVKGLFRRYGLPVGAAVALGLASLAGYLWWDGHQKAGAGEQGEQLTLALDRIEAGNPTSMAAADKQLVLLANGKSGGTAAAASLLRAGIALQEGKKADAVRMFGEVAADESAPQPFRDLATVRQVATDFDAMAPQQVVDRLKPLAVPGNAWFGNAGELLGIAYLKQGKADLAGPLFAAIARDKNVPETLRRRARQMAGLLGVDAVDDPEKTLKEDSGQPE